MIGRKMVCAAVLVLSAAACEKREQPAAMAAAESAPALAVSSRPPTATLATAMSPSAATQVPTGPLTLVADRSLV